MFGIGVDRPGRRIRLGRRFGRRTSHRGGANQESERRRNRRNRGQGHRQRPARHDLGDVPGVVSEGHRNRHRRFRQRHGPRSVEQRPRDSGQGAYADLHQGRSAAAERPGNDPRPARHGARANEGQPGQGGRCRQATAGFQNPRTGKSEKARYSQMDSGFRPAGGAGPGAADQRRQTGPGSRSPGNDRQPEQAQQRHGQDRQ
ncbi:MAG: hypothetical protein BWZ10_01665 [candidate division BRC1 bacterium ADurb.BinA364]|nr:MAG: hypothetical protein BWZ10_01665 [candidate division BRC1 bacterium ADurb.BinA364]